MTIDTVSPSLSTARAAQRAYTEHVSDPAATCRCVSGGQCGTARYLELEIEAAYARADAEAYGRYLARLATDSDLATLAADARADAELEARR